MDETLVGVDHLLQVDRFVDVVGEGCVAVKVLVGCHDVFYRSVGFNHLSSEDATGEVATIRDEVDGCLELAVARKLLYLTQTLAYLWHVLVLEGLVNAHVVVAPREVGGGTRLLSGTRRTRNGVHGNVVVEQAELGSRQQSQLYTCGETTWISHVLRLGYGVVIDFGQTIYVVVALALEAEVLRKVDYLHMGRYLVLLEERLALAVAEAEEHNIDLVERHIGTELQVGFAIQTFVHVGYKIAGVALAIGKYYLRLGMIYEQTYEFATCVACCS